MGNRHVVVTASSGSHPGLPQKPQVVRPSIRSRSFTGAFQDQMLLKEIDFWSEMDELRSRRHSRSPGSRGNFPIRPKTVSRLDCGSTWTSRMGLPDEPRRTPARGCKIGHPIPSFGDKLGFEHRSAPSPCNVSPTRKP